MDRLAHAIQPVAEALGGIGLALIALLDSSFLAFPEVNDVLIVVLTIRYPSWWSYYAGMSVVGSVLGSLALHRVGRRGGEAVLRKRFRAGVVDKAFATYRRFGLLSVTASSILPPPAPFKLLVLLAGIAGVPARKLAWAVGIGRTLRYGGTGLLALWYGDEVVQFLRDAVPRIGLWLFGAMVVGALAAFLWRRVRQRRMTAP